MHFQLFLNEMLVVLYMIWMYLNFSLENTTDKMIFWGGACIHSLSEWLLSKCLGMNVSDFGILAQITDEQP